MAERASLTARTEQANVERDLLASPSHELEVAAATCSGDLGVLMLRCNRWRVLWQ